MALFKRSKEIAEKGSIVHELCTDDFRKARKSRFVPENSPSCSSRIKKKMLTLDVKKKNCFAWCDNDQYRYNDFILEGYIELRDLDVNSSAGFIFRKANEYNYYYFLVSSKGMFRLDQVFNGHPAVLIPWTELTEPVGRLFFIRIIASGTRFIFIINNQWAAEIDSETIDAGIISFAVQNYGQADSAGASLRYFYVDSRPMEVETDFSRWSEYIAVPAQARLAYAKSMIAGGQHTLAAVQLKKIISSDPDNEEVKILLARSYTGMTMYPEAISILSDTEFSDVNREIAQTELCNAYYLSNKFLELRDFILEKIPEDKRDAVIWNHLGNAEFFLGNREKAYAAYNASLEKDPGIPQVSVNAGIAAEKMNKHDEAFDRYSQAAILFFRQENYLEAEKLLPVLKSLSKDDPDVAALQAKLDFSRGDLEAAGPVLFELAGKGSSDSGVYYLAGLFYAGKGEYSSALDLYEKALKLEPEFYLYKFRQAEALYYLGKKWEEPLVNALESKEQDAWLFNFAGIAFSSAGREEEAEKYFKLAMELEPDEEEIRINYSWKKYEQGRKEEALDMLQDFESAAVCNHIGNIYAAEKEYETAMKYYEKAMSFEPDNIFYIENCAGAWLELDAVSRAEELLVKALDIRETPGLFNKIGNLAWLKGEYSRAEAAYKKALETAPEDIDSMLNLADLNMLRRKFKEAQELVGKAEKIRPTERSAEIKKRISEATEEKLECSKCGRFWTVPKPLPEQAGLNIKGAPPGNAPAGSCPDCKKIYCISCVEDTLKENRLHCPDCKVPLKLSDQRLRYVLREQYLPEK